jgi:hypothetical protein
VWHTYSWLKVAPTKSLCWTQFLEEQSSYILSRKTLFHAVRSLEELKNIMSRQALPTILPRKQNRKRHKGDNTPGVSCSVPIKSTFTYSALMTVCLPCVLLPLQHDSEFLVPLTTLPHISASPVGGRFVADRDVMRPSAATRVIQLHALFFLPTLCPLQCEQDNHNVHRCSIRVLMPKPR